MTEDLDICASLTPLYARLQALGGVIKNEHPVIGKWPVQIVPAYTPLIQEAETQAVGRTFDGQGCRCKLFMRCCAFPLLTGSPKDNLRIHTLIKSGDVQSD